MGFDVSMIKLEIMRVFVCDTMSVKYAGNAMMPELLFSVRIG
jgi:hypothetical protein